MQKRPCFATAPPILQKNIYSKNEKAESFQTTFNDTKRIKNIIFLNYQYKTKGTTHVPDAMAAAATCFEFNALHRVVACRTCATCVAAGKASIERHARRDPHCLLGGVLKAVVVRI